MVLQQVMHETGKAHNSRSDTGKQYNQETQMDGSEEFFEIERKKRPGRLHVDRLDRMQKFFVDARNERYGSAGDARHDIGAPHAEALDKKQKGFFCACWAWTCQKGLFETYRR